MRNSYICTVGKLFSRSFESLVTVKSVAVMTVNDMIGRISAVAANNLDYLSKFQKKIWEVQAQKYNKTHRLQISLYSPLKSLDVFVE